MTPVLINKNETASTAVFTDYRALAKMYIFIFVATILVEALFLMLLDTLTIKRQAKCSTNFLLIVT